VPWHITSFAAVRKIRTPLKNERTLETGGSTHRVGPRLPLKYSGSIGTATGITVCAGWARGALLLANIGLSASVDNDVIEQSMGDFGAAQEVFILPSFVSSRS
jgi:hypothetical protein